MKKRILSLWIAVCLSASIAPAQSEKPSICVDWLVGVDADYFVAKKAIENLQYIQNPPAWGLFQPLQGTTLLRFEYQHSRISGGFEAIFGKYALQLPYSVQDTATKQFDTRITAVSSRRIGGAARMSYHLGNPVVGFDPYLSVSIGWVHYQTHIADSAYLNSLSLLDYPFADGNGGSMRPYGRVSAGLRYITPFRWGVNAEVSYRSPLFSVGISHKVR